MGETILIDVPGLARLGVIPKTSQQIKEERDQEESIQQEQLDG